MKRLAGIALLTGPALAMAADDGVLPLMQVWSSAYHRDQPTAALPTWEHGGDSKAFAALMFETADIVPLARAPYAAELAPYAHQFAGDMMKAPLLVQVAGDGSHPLYLALNKRPGSPVPQAVSDFIGFALSAQGQALAARDGHYAPLDAAAAQAERAKLEGYVAPLDPALPAYRPGARLHGYINSVGSDGMKTLMDRWMRSFRALQPDVRKGERWEHLGTLNGFIALLGGEADMAPMGRELWPAEQQTYARARGQAAPLEIRVARGGFNTPQRTTAQAIFVHPSNPLAALSVPQLRAILGAKPGLTRWGQLGLTGAWAERPIHVYMPPVSAPNTMSMQALVLQGGAWNPAAQAGSIAQTAQAIGADPAALGFGGLEEGSPDLKVLAVAPADGAAPVPLNADTASSGRYPLTRYMYIRLNRPVSAPARELLRYILSRQGQEPVRYSGYFPLNAAEVRQELDKLP